MAGILAALVATAIELLPLVRRADVSGDGDDELVLGPHPKAKHGRFFRHFGSVSVCSVGGYRVVVGVP